MYRVQLLAQLALWLSVSECALLEFPAAVCAVTPIPTMLLFVTLIWHHASERDAFFCLGSDKHGKWLLRPAITHTDAAHVSGMGIFTGV